jgi:HK97 gp10 family phage protein
MASIKIAFYGQAEFTDVIRELQNDFGVKDQNKILSSAMRVAMKPVLEKAKSLVRTDTGGLRASLRIEARKPTTKDKKSVYVSPTDTVIGTVTTGSGKQLAEKTFKNLKTKKKQKGIPSDARAVANEFGTAKMAAKPFLRPALETSSRVLLDSLTMSLLNAISKSKYKAKQPKKG